MSDNRAIPYRQAISSQAEALAGVARRVADQLDDVGPLLATTRPVFLGIGASLAAAALPVHILRARGIAAHRSGVGDLPPGTPALGDAVVAVSQSGRSRETIEALAAVEGAVRAAVVNVPGSPLTLLASAVVDLGAQRDSKASTIGFTGTLLALGMLAEAWSAPGSPMRPHTDPQRQAVTELVDDFQRERSNVFEVLCQRLSSVSSIDVVGEQASVASAEEGSLLLREVCRVPAASFELRNYLHGAEESARPCEIAGPTGHLLIGGERALRLAGDLAADGHLVGLISDLPPVATAALSRHGVVTVSLPKVSPVERVVLETIVFQHISLGLAETHGVSPDEFLRTSLDTKIDDLATVQLAGS